MRGRKKQLIVIKINLDSKEVFINKRKALDDTTEKIIEIPEIKNILNQAQEKPKEETKEEIQETPEEKEPEKPSEETKPEEPKGEEKTEEKPEQEPSN